MQWARGDDFSVSHQRTVRGADGNLINMMSYYYRGQLWIVDCKGVKQPDEIFTPA
jgi:hypothetical protein